MKLYRSPTGHWAGNQEEAKALGKEHSTTFQLCDVPYDKAGLLSFLNEHRVGAQTNTAVSVPAQPVAQPSYVEVQDRTTALRQKLLDRLSMEEYITQAPLDEAVALAEHIMARIRDFVRN